MKLIINEIPPTINKYIGRDNRWQYQADKKKYHKAVLEAIKKVPYEQYNKCEMTIIFYFKDRRKHDPCNYSKFLLDGLVEAGVIKDDCFQCIENYSEIGAYDKENPRVEVFILER